MKIIEWTPGHWWIVEVTGPDGSYTPIEGSFRTRAAAEAALEHRRSSFSGAYYPKLEGKR